MQRDDLSVGAEFDPDPVPGFRLGLGEFGAAVGFAGVVAQVVGVEAAAAPDRTIGYAWWLPDLIQVPSRRCREIAVPAT